MGIERAWHGKEHSQQIYCIYCYSKFYSFALGIPFLFNYSASEWASVGERVLWACFEKILHKQPFPTSLAAPFIVIYNCTLFKPFYAHIFFTLWYVRECVCVRACAVHSIVLRITLVCSRRDSYHAYPCIWYTHAFRPIYPFIQMVQMDFVNATKHSWNWNSRCHRYVYSIERHTGVLCVHV